MDTANPAASKRTRRISLLVATPILTAVALTGCGAQDSASGGGSSADGLAANSVAGGTVSGPAKAAPSAAAHAIRALDGQGSDTGSEVQQRAVISTGDIALTSSDVTATRTRLDAVLARAGGRVADERTVTDDHGTVTGSHLVVRVPSSRFDQAMTALAGIASLRSSSRSAQDVTTRVIDLQARIRAERAGVGRLRQLVSHTASLGALLAVERALTQRQGELESLQQQHAYLSDQTSEATITVDVTLRTKPAAPAKAATGGFVGGVRHGWHGLVTVVGGFLVGLGAFLPFAGAALILAIPGWPLVRRLQRRTS
ncbi:MAG TPA: DUF4349 domain-containing protein [Nocardioides sp.]|jgi:hypothetical protein|nr:DUF4349 domain-containing protein [Nocardioides sp.]